MISPELVQTVMRNVIGECRRELLFGFDRFRYLKRFNAGQACQKAIMRTFPTVMTVVPRQTHTLKLASLACTSSISPRVYGRKIPTWRRTQTTGT